MNPPSGRYVPLQVRYGDRGDGVPDGWRVLTTCIMLNRTSRVQVAQVLPAYFDAFPDPASAARALSDAGTYEGMEDLVRPLGFAHTRTRRLALFSYEWLWYPQWKSIGFVRNFTGCGRYAEDAWRIFIDRDLTRAADDAVLEQWRQALRGGEVGPTGETRSSPEDHAVPLPADSGGGRG